LIVFHPDPVAALEAEQAVRKELENLAHKKDWLSTAR
jgi:hypothetical protein